MGILRNGILGGFSNRTGGVVGRIVKGKSIVSGVPHPMLQPRTALQIEQQMRFKLVSEFLACFINLIRIGFAASRKHFPMALAMQYNYREVIGGTYPDFTIKYDKVLFSKGSLCGPDSPSVQANGNGLWFSWQVLAENRYNLYTDKACFLAYCPASKCAATAAYAASRSDLGYQLLLPFAFSGELLHCYMSFAAEKGKAVSDSVYLGIIQN